MRRLLKVALVALGLGAAGLGTSGLSMLGLATPALAQKDLLDINSATDKQLEALPGVGPVRAAAIIKGRPYKGKDELVQKKILTQGVYDGIKDRIIAKQKS